MKSDGILKGTQATCTRYRNYMICFNRNEILDVNLHYKFRSTWTCFGNIIRKTELISLACILEQVYTVIMESAIFCCITKTFCPETLKFLWDGFYWNPSWNRSEHGDGRVSESKWEPFYWDINHQSRVILEQCWKILSISLKLWTIGSGSEELCHYVRFISQLS